MNMIRADAIGKLGWEAVTKNLNREITVETVVAGFLGMVDKSGQPAMTQEELRNPAAFLVMNQFAQFVRDALPVHVRERIRESVGEDFLVDSSVAPTEHPRVKALLAEVAELRAKIASQYKTIEDLKKLKSRPK